MNNHLLSAAKQSVQKKSIVSYSRLFYLLLILDRGAVYKSRNERWQGGGRGGDVCMLDGVCVCVGVAGEVQRAL